MRRSLSAVLVCSAAISLAAACHKRGESEESRHAAHDHDGDHDESHDEAHASPLQGPGGEARSAARNIASARCEREARCSNIGADKKYATEEVCEERIRSDWANDLNAYDCPKGVVDGELEECLNAVRNEECNSPFDTLSRVSACTSGQICAE